MLDGGKLDKCLLALRGWRWGALGELLVGQHARSDGLGVLGKVGDDLLGCRGRGQVTDMQDARGGANVAEVLRIGAHEAIQGRRSIVLGAPVAVGGRRGDGRVAREVNVDGTIEEAKAFQVGHGRGGLHVVAHLDKRYPRFVVQQLNAGGVGVVYRSKSNYSLTTFQIAVVQTEQYCRNC